MLLWFGVPGDIYRQAKRESSTKCQFYCSGETITLCNKQFESQTVINMLQTHTQNNVPDCCILVRICFFSTHIKLNPVCKKK